MNRPRYKEVKDVKLYIVYVMYIDHDTSTYKKFSFRVGICTHISRDLGSVDTGKIR